MDYNRVNAYIEGLYQQRELTKKQFTTDTELKNFGQVIDDDVARMLQIIITIAKPQKILEIGTSIGFSTVSMANAIKHYDGKIVTIELDPNVAKHAIENFKREGVQDLIEVIVGEASAIVSNMDEEFDLIFQDVGDKRLYGTMIDDYIRLLKPGGLLIAEDTLFPVILTSSESGDSAKICESLDTFNEEIANYPLFESTLLPIGDGLTVAVKRPS